MHWSEIKVHKHLAECKDSLLFDSGEVIAELTTTSGVYVRVTVVGETRILYNGTLYRYTANYPRDLLNAIKTGEIYQMVEKGQAEIQNNNWFEITVEYLRQSFAEVLEAPLCEFTPESLREYLINYVETTFPYFLAFEMRHH